MTNHRGATPLLKPPKVVVDNLADVIQDGKFLLKVGDRCILRRDHRPDRKVSLAEVSRIDDDEVILYDLTLGQMFVFKLLDPPTLKLIP